VKKRVINTVLYTIALLIFIFGNSVNVIHFCCDVCRVQGTQVFNEGVCHEFESTDVISFSDRTNTEVHGGLFSCFGKDGRYPFQLTDEHEECSINRISIILDEFQSLKLIFLLFITVFLFSGFYMNDFLTKRNHSAFSLIQPYIIPLTGRQLLNRICILRN